MCSVLHIKKKEEQIKKKKITKNISFPYPLRLIDVIVGVLPLEITH